MNNRLHNVRNPNQTDTRKVLCVCSAGLLRSPTAANVIHREFGYNTRAAGTASDFALVVVDMVLFDWADEIVCIEQVHLGDLQGKDFFESNKPITVLDVPDYYEWMDPKLQQIILDQYNAKSYRLE